MEAQTFQRLKAPVSSLTLATAIELDHGSQPGVDIEVVSPLAACRAGSLNFLVSEHRALADDIPIQSVLIAASDVDFPRLSCLLLRSENPRLDYMKALNWLQATTGFESRRTRGVAADADIHSTAVLSRDVELGDASRIGANVCIEGLVAVGAHSVIAAGACIGQAGFGFERDAVGIPHRFPQLGGVIVGSECYIGANTTVARGALADTVIGDYVKIDDRVYVAHHCVIGDRTLIAGGATICGGVAVGSDAWIGAGSMIKQGVSVGEGAVVGIGAVVIRDVAAGDTVAGNPARVIQSSR